MRLQEVFLLKEQKVSFSLTELHRLCSLCTFMMDSASPDPWDDDHEKFERDGSWEKFGGMVSDQIFEPNPEAPIEIEPWRAEALVKLIKDKHYLTDPIITRLLKKLEEVKS